MKATKRIKKWTEQPPSFLEKTRLGIAVFVLVMGNSVWGETAQSFSDLAKVHCVNCHGPEKQKGRFRIDTIDLSNLTVSHADKLSDAIELLNELEMPPKEESKMYPEERLRFVEILAKSLREFYTQRRAENLLIARRLSRQQYIHSLQDLLGIDANVGRDLPEDAVSEDGFSNNANDLTISELHMQYYIRTAQTALDHAIPTEKQMPEIHRFSFDVTQKIRGKNPQIFPFMITSILDTQMDPRFVKGKTFKPDYDVKHHGALNMSVTAVEAGTKRFKLSEVGITLPPVFQGYEESGGKRRGPNPNIKIRLREAPRKGLFRIVARVAKTDDSSIDPVLRVTYGNLVGKQGLKVDTRTVGEPKSVRTKPGEFQEIEFFGELSNFPTPQLLDTVGRSVIMLWNDVYTYEKDRASPALFVDKVSFEGPLFRSWPPETYQRVFIDSENKDNEPDYAREIIHLFARRAFRTEVSIQEIEPYYTLWKAARKEGASFQDSIKEALVGVLCSPRFLYMTRPQEGLKPATSSTTDWAIRMAYFLWDGPPDESLMELAESGELAKTEVLDAQIERMIQDPRSWRFVRSFCKDWLKLKNFFDKPHDGFFTRYIKDAMGKETYHFFADLIRNNRSYLNCIDSEYAMVNAVLAEFYGIKDVVGSHFRKVALEPGHPRGGLLTQGAFMVANAAENAQSHPIRRGVWLTERILGRHLPPPPKTVNDVSEEIDGFLDLPLKEQIKLHQANESCATCHRKIDPYGIPFENFDGNGKWREEVTRVLSRNKGKVRMSEGVLIDPSVEIDGEPIDDIHAFKSYLLKERKDEAARAFVEHLCTYALGRSLNFSDRPHVDKILSEFVSLEYRVTDLLKIIIKSELFRQ